MCLQTVAVSNIGERLERSKPFAVDDSHKNDLPKGGSFALGVTTLSGNAIEVEGLTPTCSISELCQCFASKFGYQASVCCHLPHEIGQLYNGTQRLDNMDSTLAEAGLEEGAILTYIWTAELATLKLVKGDILKVRCDLVSTCDMLMEAMETHGDDARPLPDSIKVSTLRKALEYSEYHGKVPAADIRRPVRGTDLRECGVSEWDLEYIDMPREMLVDLIVVAKTLDMQELLSLACAKIASLINGKSVQEIQQQFDANSLRSLRNLYVSNALTPWASSALDMQ